jgi:hypothetical protein
LLTHLRKYWTTDQEWFNSQQEEDIFSDIKTVYPHTEAHTAYYLMGTVKSFLGVEGKAVEA